jgi:hypothetical protein
MSAAAAAELADQCVRPSTVQVHQPLMHRPCARDAGSCGAHSQFCNVRTTAPVVSSVGIARRSGCMQTTNTQIWDSRGSRDYTWVKGTSRPNTQQFRDPHEQVSSPPPYNSWSQPCTAILVLPRSASHRKGQGLHSREGPCRHGSSMTSSPGQELNKLPKAAAGKETLPAELLHA